jgi:hypothetical protein
VDRVGGVRHSSLPYSPFSSYRLGADLLDDRPSIPVDPIDVTFVPAAGLSLHLAARGGLRTLTCARTLVVRIVAEACEGARHAGLDLGRRKERAVVACCDGTSAVLMRRGLRPSAEQKPSFAPGGASLPGAITTATVPQGVAAGRERRPLDETAVGLGEWRGAMRGPSRLARRLLRGILYRRGSSSGRTSSRPEPGVLIGTPPPVFPSVAARAVGTRADFMNANDARRT